MARRTQAVDGGNSAEIARRVRVLRVRLKLTQEELARAANVSAKFVSQLENGHVNVSVGVLQRVVEDGLGMSLSAFFAVDGVADEVSLIMELLADKPVGVRRVAYRLVRALIDEET